MRFVSNIFPLLDHTPAPSDRVPQIQITGGASRQNKMPTQAGNLPGVLPSRCYPAPASKDEHQNGRNATQVASDRPIQTPNMVANACRREIPRSGENACSDGWCHRSRETWASRAIPTVGKPTQPGNAPQQYRATLPTDKPRLQRCRHDVGCAGIVVTVIAPTELICFQATCETDPHTERQCAEQKCQRRSREVVAECFSCTGHRSNFYRL